MVMVKNLRFVNDERLVARIDRTTCFGNPFHITATRTRAQAISLFKDYWQADAQRWLRHEAWMRLQGRDLACWCAPLPCHGDVILKWLYEELD